MHVCLCIYSWISPTQAVTYVFLCFPNWPLNTRQPIGVIFPGKDAKEESFRWGLNDKKDNFGLGKEESMVKGWGQRGRQGLPTLGTWVTVTQPVQDMLTPSSIQLFIPTLATITVNNYIMKDFLILLQDPRVFPVLQVTPCSPWHQCWHTTSHTGHATTTQTEPMNSPSCYMTLAQPLQPILVFISTGLAIAAEHYLTSRTEPLRY